MEGIIEEILCDWRRLRTTYHKEYTTKSGYITAEEACGFTVQCLQYILCEDPLPRFGLADLTAPEQLAAAIEDETVMIVLHIGPENTSLSIDTHAVCCLKSRGTYYVMDSYINVHSLEIRELDVDGWKRYVEALSNVLPDCNGKTWLAFTGVTLYAFFVRPPSVKYVMSGDIYKLKSHAGMMDTMNKLKALFDDPAFQAGSRYSGAVSRDPPSERVSRPGSAEGGYIGEVDGEESKRIAKEVGGGQHFIPIEKAMCMLPNDCYQCLAHSHSESLEAAIEKFASEGNRIYNIGYSNPLMKRHKAMAHLSYLDPNGHQHHDLLLDKMCHR